jgi:transposase-like protein
MAGPGLSLVAASRRPDAQDVPTAQCRVQLGVAEAYPGSEGSLKDLAAKVGVDDSLVHCWLKRYQAGEHSLDLQREHELAQAAQLIAALGRNASQLTMGLDLQGAHRRPRDEQRAVVDSFPPGGDMVSSQKSL